MHIIYKIKNYKLLKAKAHGKHKADKKHGVLFVINLFFSIFFLSIFFFNNEITKIFKNE